MLTVYHGSIASVTQPLAMAGRPNLDFGRGFYITKLREQAEHWATIVGRRHPDVTPLLNIYELDTELIKQHDYHTLHFESYNGEWLDFIAASRKGNEPWQNYDLIEGGVANDKVFDAIEAYLNGLASKETAIGLLTYQAPNNQICLLNQQLIDECLHFIGSEPVRKEAKSC